MAPQELSRNENAPALKAVKRAAKRREDADDAFREAVLAAATDGQSLRSIARAAGLSHARVHQIVKE